MKSKIILFVLFLLNLIVSILLFVLIIKKNDELTFDDCYSSVVEIKSTIDGDDYFGSAVCISENVFVTNYHIIKSSSSIISYRTCFSNEYNFASIKAVDEQNDLALLSFVDSKIQPIKYSVDKLKNGNTVYSIGNTLNQGITISKGIISNCSVVSDSQNYICSDNIIDEGNSGGALINSKKELVGITSFKIKNLGYSYSIPCKKILDFLNSSEI